MKRLFFWWAVLGCCLPAMASAQTNAKTEAPLSPVVTVNKGALAPYQNETVKNETLRRVPGAVTQLDQTSWQDHRASIIKDVVDYAPGVFAQPRNGAESMRLSIRGSGLTRMFQGRGLLVMQDGVPINTADGGFEFPVIDPWLVRSAEILRGANASVYGASTLGGAIDFVTPTGISESGITLRGELGGFGDLRGMTSYGMQNGQQDAYIAFSGFQQDGFRQNNKQGTGRLNSNFGWTNGHVSQRLYFSHIDTDAQIPGAISKAEMAEDPRQTNPNNINGRYRRDLDITRIAHKADWRQGAGQMASTVYYTYRYLDNPVTTYLKEHNHDMGMRVSYTQDIGLDRVIVGTNLAYGMGDEGRFTNLSGNPGSRILNRRLSALTSELYGQYERHLAGSLFGIAALQGTYAQRQISQSFVTEAKQEKDYAGLSPRLGLRYDLDGHTQFFTNVSRSFEPPTWDELSGGNSPGFEKLKAQTATTAEIGARGVLQGVSWEAAYYHSWLKNEFVNYRFESGLSNTINADKTKHEGIELGMHGDILRDVFRVHDRIGVQGAYSWNHFTLDNDRLYGRNQLPGVPEHVLRSEVMYHHPSGISFGPNIEFIPTGYPVDLTNNGFTDRYFLYGARAAWQLPKRKIQFYVEARNLADQTYIATTNVIPDSAGNDGRYYYPGEGRTIYAGFRAAF